MHALCSSRRSSSRLSIFMNEKEPCILFDKCTSASRSKVFPAPFLQPAHSPLRPAPFHYPRTHIGTIGALPFSCAVRKLSTGQPGRLKKRTERHTPIVVPVLRDVAYPGQGLVPALLHNLEVPDLDARDGKVRDLELDGDWRALLLRLCVCFGGLMGKQWETRRL